MINFLNKLFRKKEEIIKFRDLDNWVRENIDLEFREIKHVFEEINSLKAKLEKDLEGLRAVNVNEKKAEDRIKDMVKGNKDSYIAAVNNFMVNIDLPSEINYYKIKVFSDDVEDSLEALNKKTVRNFHIVRELIGNELAEVAKDIKDIDSQVKNLKKFLQPMREAEGVIDLIKEIHKAIDHQKNTEGKTKELKRKKDEIIKEMQETYNKLDVLKNSSLQKEFHDDKEKIKRIEDKLAGMKSEIFSIFATLNKALKKYNNMAYIKIIDSYINNPFSTLMADNDLLILQHLAEVKKLIQEDKIELRDEKKKRSLDIIESFNKEMIQKFKEKLNEEVSHKKELEEKINNNKIEEELATIDKELDRKQSEIDEIDSLIEKQHEFKVEEKIKDAAEILSRIKGLEIKIENDVE